MQILRSMFMFSSQMGTSIAVAFATIFSYFCDKINDDNKINEIKFKPRVLYLFWVFILKLNHKLLIVFTRKGRKKDKF